MKEIKFVDKDNNPAGHIVSSKHGSFYKPVKHKGSQTKPLLTRIKNDAWHKDTTYNPTNI
jgi:hypothetical protein